MVHCLYAEKTHLFVFVFACRVRDGWFCFRLCWLFWLRGLYHKRYNLFSSVTFVSKSRLKHYNTTAN